MPIYMKLHPMTTMLGDDNVGLSGDVKISDQARMALHNWLHDPRQFETEEISTR